MSAAVASLQAPDGKLRCWPGVCLLCAAFTHAMLPAATASICAGYAISKWLVQTRLSSRGGDWSTLTPLQAQRLREMLTDLGPAFVKIGQVREPGGT